MQLIHYPVQHDAMTEHAQVFLARSSCHCWVRRFVVLQFPKEQYATEMSENAGLSRLEVVAKLKRNSTGFSRSAYSLRVVMLLHQAQLVAAVAIAPQETRKLHLSFPARLQDLRKIMRRCANGIS